MAAMKFTPPKQWEDWCDWALGIWLMLSPWALHFAYDSTATRNAIIIGLLVVLAEAVTLTRVQVWKEWINVVLGAWLAISPWVLNIASLAAKANFVVVGTLIAALALHEVWQVRRERASQVGWMRYAKRNDRF